MIIKSTKPTKIEIIDNNKLLIRKCDELGRVTIPKEFRDILSISIKENILISLNGDDIIFKKNNNLFDYKKVLESVNNKLFELE
ncbi:MAG: AbrB/MazE/SpoVT family DNA-binding domain-containing protein [Bacilli bacterium]